GPFRRCRSLERQLVEEQKNVHRDQRDRDEGSGEARYIVFQGEHLGPRTASYWGVMSSMAANNWPRSCFIHGGALQRGRRTLKEGDPGSEGFDCEAIFQVPFQAVCQKDIGRNA